MSLQKWLEYGWLRSHKSSRKEISDLLRIIDRDLQDATGDISADWRFGISYNAALKDEEGAKRVIDAVPKRHPFEMRYDRIENVDWESCSRVLDSASQLEALREGWFN